MRPSMAMDLGPALGAAASTPQCLAGQWQRHTVFGTRRHQEQQVPEEARSADLRGVSLLRHLREVLQHLGTRKHTPKSHTHPLKPQHQPKFGSRAIRRATRLNIKRRTTPTWPNHKDNRWNIGPLICEHVGHIAETKEAYRINLNMGALHGQGGTKETLAPTCAQTYTTRRQENGWTSASVTPHNETSPAHTRSGYTGRATASLGA